MTLEYVHLTTAGRSVAGFADYIYIIFTTLKVLKTQGAYCMATQQQLKHNKQTSYNDFETLTNKGGSIFGAYVLEAELTKALSRGESKRFTHFYPPVLVSDSPPDEQAENDNGFSQGASYRAKPCAKLDAPRYKLNDVGNGRRFVEAWRGEAWYLTDLKCWMIWDGKRWRQDGGSHVFQMATTVAEAIFSEAERISDAKIADKVTAHANRTESFSKINTMVKTAERDRRMVTASDAFDRNPFLLGVENGTVDLQSGELREHAKEDRITKMVSVTYDPEAKAPRWEHFLDQIFAGRQSVIDYIQRVIGYTLTADTSEQCLFLLHGSGRNGKSVLLNVLRELLCEYAKNAEFSTFLQNHKGGVRNDIAALKGARLVTASEPDSGQKLSESVVKSMTGQDAVTTRFLRREYFTYTPTAKIWLACNHRPEIKGGDYALWRRIFSIPFEVTIPPAQQDKHLLTKLRAELPGILAWAVRGALEWQRQGLNPPEEVLKATEAYRSDDDPLSGFITACCELDPTASVKASVLYDAYKEWACHNGMYPLSLQLFSKALTRKGFETPKRTKKGYFRRGITLKSETVQGDLLPNQEQPDADAHEEPSSGKKVHLVHPSSPACSN